MTDSTPKNDNLNQMLEELHRDTITELLARIRSGEATAADFNVARQLLRDNGISAVAKPGSPLDSLTKELPFQAEED
jgi:hypothetical protein